MFLFELMLGKQTRRLMDLAISMGQRNHFKELVEMIMGCEEKYARANKFNASSKTT
jgi:hypothetical protein